MSASNAQIAQILAEIGEYLAMQNVPFKPRAYAKAAENVAGWSEELAAIYQSGGIGALRDIPGVGAAIAEKIEEILKTGRLKYYQDLKKKTPVDLAALSNIEGLGPKSIRKFYQKLGVKNLADLELAAKQGKIRQLPGFGQKSEEKILKGIGFAQESGGRFILGQILPEEIGRAHV